MKELINIRDIKKIELLENEYDLQKALMLERKLRLMVKDDSTLIPIRKKIRKLIKDYENRNWSNSDNISNSQIVESDKTELLVENERRFQQKRKEIIRKKLRDFDLNQQELGELLGHKKSYMSELMNGVSQFSLKDLVIIHRILKIDLDVLIPTFLQSEVQNKVRFSIRKLNKPKLKLEKEDLFA